MDKNAGQTLDPKLKEIYERVMNTQVKSPAAAPVTTPQTAAPVQTAPAAAPVIPPTQPQPIAPPAVAPPIAPQVMQSTVTFGNAALGKQEGIKKKGGVSPILLVLTGLVFFAIYTLFWLKFFNIPIPFLPS